MTARALATRRRSRNEEMGRGTYRQSAYVRMVPAMEAALSKYAWQFHLWFKEHWKVAGWWRCWQIRRALGPKVLARYLRRRPAPLEFAHAVALADRVSGLDREAIAYAVAKTRGMIRPKGQRARLWPDPIPQHWARALDEYGVMGNKLGEFVWMYLSLYVCLHNYYWVGRVLPKTWETSDTFRVRRVRALVLPLARR